MPFPFFGGFRINYDNCNRYSQLQKLFTLFTRICAYYAYAQVATNCAGILPLHPFRLRLAHYQYAHPLAKSRQAKPSQARRRHAYLTPPKAAQLIQSSWQRVGARAFK